MVSANPPLTTIAQDYGRAGEVLVDALIAQLSGRPVSGELLAPRLVTRASG